MCDHARIEQIARELSSALSCLFPDGRIEAVLFGSFARGDADAGSDVDLLFLVDAPREEIARLQWQIGDAAAEILMEHGIVVSPLVENREWYRSNADLMPLYRNIEREGVKLGA